MRNIDAVLLKNFPGNRSTSVSSDVARRRLQFVQHGPVCRAERDRLLAEFRAGDVDGKQLSESAVRLGALLLRQVQCS
jgi:hypothetical protein